jgi:DNA (cytosine-5)-methyltransferase 1
MTLTYAELFAGAGGLSRGLEAAGFHCVAHAEIEPHARAVLRYRWPDTRLDGDVTQIDGRDYAGITLLSGGSPCQDLSVAGKRAGLTGSRSSLFHEQCRIWKESGAPYLLWENVHGAFSSNGGKDFATVLSTLVGATIPVPADGWQSGGVAAGRDAVAAWRVLDLQHFGPPQRRVRVFVLAARAGGVDPAEVLAVGEGLCRHPSPRQQAREGVAGRAAGGVGAGGVMAWDDECNPSVEMAGTLVSRSRSGGRREGVLAFHHTQTPISGEMVPAMQASRLWAVDVAPMIDTTMFGKHTGNHQSLSMYDAVAKNTGRPRRLTPRECEALMSWPTNWTQYGTKDDGTVYELSDTARYRLCGNGVGSVCVEWIATRLAAALVGANDGQQAARMAA